MDAADDLRLGQRQQIVVALQVAARAATSWPMFVVGFLRRRHQAQAVEPMRETLAPIGGLIQVMLLDHRAHGAVEHEDALAQRLLQARDALRVFPRQIGHALRANRVSTSKCGGRFSRVTDSQVTTTRPAFSAWRRSSFSVKPRLT